MAAVGHTNAAGVSVHPQPDVPLNHLPLSSPHSTPPPAGDRGIPPSPPTPPLPSPPLPTLLPPSPSVAPASRRRPAESAGSTGPTAGPSPPVAVGWLPRPRGSPRAFDCASQDRAIRPNRSYFDSREPPLPATDSRKLGELEPRRENQNEPTSRTEPRDPKTRRPRRSSPRGGSLSARRGPCRVRTRAR